MAATFDPTQIAPDWDFQRQQLARNYQQGLINLNAQKNNLFAQYGFLNSPDFTTSGQPVDFSNLQVDPNQQYGAYRNELKTEADALDAAQNGPSRGFSGGLSNQAYRAAQQAVGARQTAFQQNLQQNLGNLNLSAGNQNFNYQQGMNQVGADQAQYAGSQALWQALNPTAPATVPGASGGGSTPLIVSPYAAKTAAQQAKQTLKQKSLLGGYGSPITVGR